MVATMPGKLNRSVASVVQRIIAAGEMSRHEHLQLASALLSDFQMTEEDRRQINQVFDYVKAGKLKLVD